MARMLKRSIVAVGVLLTCHLSLVTCCAAAAEAAPKIGYVNLAKIFDGYQRTKESDQTLEQKGKQKQTELESRFGEIKKLRQSLELLNDQARDTKAREIEEKSDEFQRLKTRTERELVRERNQIARVILDEIETAVSDFAKSNGFAIILDQRSLLYGQEAHDVTAPILTLLNDRYASAKSGKTQAR